MVSLAVLVAVCAVIFPVSWPAAQPQEKDLSEPFPCQNRPCGCRSAKQCWKKCCCFSHQQKVAWAKEHGVTIPLTQSADAKDQPQKLNLVSNRQHRSCCRTANLQENSSNAVSGEDCCSEDSSATKSCCAKRPQRETAKIQYNDSKSSVLIGMLVEKCQGVSVSWVALPWIILEKPQELPLAYCPLIASVIPHSDAESGVSDRPPTPPPKPIDRSLCVI